MLPRVDQLLTDLSPNKMEFVKVEIATLKEQGIVEDAPSDTTWAAPIVVVKKADGGWRLCTDFRKLNACLLYTSPSPRDRTRSRMPSSA